MRQNLLVVLIVAGCAVPDSPSPHEANLDVEVPEAWSNDAPSSHPPARFWETFESADLDRFVSAALDDNPDLRVSLARLDQAANQARIAGADLVPTLDFGVGGRRERRNFVGFPDFGGGDDVLSTTTNSFGASLSTSWELDLWGRVRSREDAAQADAQAAVEDFMAARLSLIGQVCRAYFSLREAEAQWNLAKETTESFRTTAKVVRNRYERGTRSPLDLRLALDNLHQAEALEVDRHRQEQVARRAMEVLLGRYPRGTLDLAGSLPDLVEDVPVGLPAQLLSRRPDMRAFERRLASSHYRLQEAKASLYPRLSLTASAGTSSEELKDMVDSDYFVWNLVGNLTQPLFQGGRLRGQVEVEEARVREQVATFASALLNAFSEVENALSSGVFLRDRESALIESVKQAEAARRLAEERYRRGLDTFLQVSDAQRRELTARSQLLQVQRSRLENRVDLFIALGGGFDDDAIDGQETSP